MHRYEVRALLPGSALEGIFYVEALGPAAANASIYPHRRWRPPEIVDAMKVAGDANADSRYRLALSGEPSIEMTVRLLQA